MFNEKINIKFVATIHSQLPKSLTIATKSNPKRLHHRLISLSLQICSVHVYSLGLGFLRGCSLPYCSLYDEGYTSLGEAKETVKNAALLREDGTYRSAHELHDESLERSNRSPKSAEGSAFEFPEEPMIARSVSTEMVSPHVILEVKGLADTEAVRPPTPMQSALQQSRSSPVRAKARSVQQQHQQSPEWSAAARRALPLALLTVAIAALMSLRVRK